MDLLSINTSPLTSYLRKKYYDLEATLYIMRMLKVERVVDGFEFELLAEWNPDHSPIGKDAKFDRELAWENSRKYRVEEIAALLNSQKLPILSVHGNRDVGACLCSDNEDLRRRGEELICQALFLCIEVGSGVGVFHLWDPWLNEVDFDRIRRRFEAVVSDFPSVRASVENIPIYVPGVEPHSVVQEYRWITLDTKWAAKYHELAKYRPLKNRIIDIHIHSRAVDSRWSLAPAGASLADLLRIIETEWGYRRIFTLDTEGSFANMKWKDLVSGIAAVRKLSCL